MRLFTVCTDPERGMYTAFTIIGTQKHERTGISRDEALGALIRVVMPAINSPCGVTFGGIFDIDGKDTN